MSLGRRHSRRTPGSPAHRDSGTTGRGGIGMPGTPGTFGSTTSAGTSSTRRTFTSPPFFSTLISSTSMAPPDSPLNFFSVASSTFVTVISGCVGV